MIILGFIEQMALSNDVDVRNVTNDSKYLGEQTNVLSKEIEASYGRSCNLKIRETIAQ
ncbi:hypothetical protein PAXY110619_18495 [Paenibacillus xylanexedens]|uniref:Uncharacterized protein n=1 Tax=Paenibacillus xylanexedens TaxID=528191 RepID=A0ABS4RWD7_PAEXY|nr:hypothetical protein [Paenibacillus xylanexedens]